MAAGSPRLAPRTADLLWLAVSFLVLLPCLVYPYRSLIPDPGFILGPDWEVLVVEPCRAGEACLEVGDRVLTIGGVEREAFLRDRTVEPFRAFEETGRAEVRLLRGGEVRTIEARTRSGLAGLLRLDSLTALFPLVFWLVGTAAVLFLRPRDERWTVLVLFHYVTALWFAAGLASFRQVAGSAVVFHVFIWLFLPLAVHLHLLLPEPLFRRRQWWALAPIYATSLVLIVLDGSRRLGDSRGLFLLWFLGAVGISVGLLLARQFLPASPAARLACRTMLFGVVGGFGPVTVLQVLPAVAPRLFSVAPDPHSFHPWSVLALLVAIPILPMSYIYTVYKHHLGALEFRANRLLGVYGFFTLYITLCFGTLFLVGKRWGSLQGPALAAIVAVTLAFVAAGGWVRGRFQALVDRHVFGIRHSPEAAVSIVAAKIAGVFDRGAMAQVIAEEILPALLVRRSALYLFGERGVETLYEQALPGGEEAPAEAELRALLPLCGRSLPPEQALPGFAWVRLAVPLVLQGEVLGLWLLGRRDPDDFYPRGDVTLLATVASQVAPVLQNIGLYERAREEIAQRRAAEEESRRSEQRYRNLFEQLLHSQKMEAIGRLSAGLAHDFNNCLLAIFGYSDLLLQSHAGDELLAGSVHGIREAAQRAASLTRQLLAFTRQQPMELRQMSLNAVVRGVEELVRQVLGRGVELTTRLAPELPPVRVDPGQIEQVILNMAVNARDAMPRGGRLTLETDLVDLPAGATPHPDLAAGPFLRLRVSDTGIGMDAETQARIFEPFFSTKKLGEGTGLGLSTAYGIVKQSGGHIAVESAPGEGAAFSILLPAQPVAAVADSTWLRPPRLAR